MRRILFIALLGYWIFGLLGCATVKQAAKGFLAISTKEIEEAREQAIIKIVDYDYTSCYQKVKERLKQIESYIYAQRDDFIAVYISKTDTTPAGIFFKQIDQQKTQVEIASPAADTKEYLAEKIFSAL